MTTVQALFIGHASTVPSRWSAPLPLQCPVKPTCQLPALCIAFSDDFPLPGPGQTLLPFPGVSKEGAFSLPSQRSCWLPNICLMLYLWDILKGTVLKEVSHQNTLVCVGGPEKALEWKERGFLQEMTGL